MSAVGNISPFHHFGSCFCIEMEIKNYNYWYNWINHQLPYAIIILSILCWKDITLCRIQFVKTDVFQRPALLSCYWVLFYTQPSTHFCFRPLARIWTLGLLSLCSPPFQSFVWHPFQVDKDAVAVMAAAGSMDHTLQQVHCSVRVESCKCLVSHPYQTKALWKIEELTIVWSAKAAILNLSPPKISQTAKPIMIPIR